MGTAFLALLLALTALLVPCSSEAILVGIGSPPPPDQIFFSAADRLDVPERTVFQDGIPFQFAGTFYAFDGQSTKGISFSISGTGPLSGTLTIGFQHDFPFLVPGTYLAGSALSGFVTGRIDEVSWVHPPPPAHDGVIGRVSLRSFFFDEQRTMFFWPGGALRLVMGSSLTLEGAGTFGAAGDSAAPRTEGLFEISGCLFVGEACPFQIPEPIPEPTTLLLLGSALAGLAFIRRKRSR